MIMNAGQVKLSFIGVGAAKAGTSWLATCLSEHPELCMAEPTALNYFCGKAIWPGSRVNGGLGLSWVAERFVQCQPGQRLGEFSPNYLCDPDAPGLIFRHNPGCRLIFSFRHPVETVFAFYHQTGKQAPVAKEFEGFLDDYPGIEARLGLHYLHLRRFLEIFPREQCLFLIFDDIQRDPQSVLKRCFSFLEVESDFTPPSLNRRINERATPRSKTLLAATYWVQQLIQKNTSSSVLQKWLWKLQLYRVHWWILRRNLEPFTPAPIREATRKRLLEFYCDDTRALARFLDRDLSYWER